MGMDRRILGTVRGTRLSFVLLAGAVLATAGVGCGQILGIADWKDVGDAAVLPDGGVSDGAMDRATSADAALTDADPCEDGGGVNIPSSEGAFCIDRIEVTSAEYAEFEDKLSQQTYDTLPPECAFKSYNDGGLKRPYIQFIGPSLPAVAVDWCDAYAYCQWKNKGLCGERDGGSVPRQAYQQTVDEWYTACSRDGTQTYPYGNTFDKTACDTEMQNSSVGPADAGSYPGCMGGYPGLLDMSGNVAEIENSCWRPADAGPEAGPELDNCYARGGNYFFPPGFDNDSCLSQTPVTRGDAFVNGNGVGFRCCWSP
jgi:sulfatase modifying factor 1